MLHFVVVQILPAWPFDDRDPKLITLFLPHHAFSFIITIPVIITGMAEDVNVQKIGASLLFAGGVSGMILAYTRTLDRRDPCQAWQAVCMYVCMRVCVLYWKHMCVGSNEFIDCVQLRVLHQAIAWIINGAFYDYCRWWVFPVCAYNLLNDRWASMGTAMQVAGVVVLVFMVFFNFLVGVDLHMTVFNRIKVALAGGQKKDSEKPKSLSE